MKNYFNLIDNFKHLDYFAALHNKLDVLNKKIRTKEKMIYKAVLSLFSVSSLITLMAIMYHGEISSIFVNLVASLFLSLFPIALIGGVSMGFYVFLTDTTSTKEKKAVENLKKQFACELQNNPDILNDIVKLVKDEKAQEIFIKIVDKVRKKDTEDVFSLYSELLVNHHDLIETNKQENERAEFLNQQNINFKVEKKEFELNTHIKEKYLL